jgi:type III restriction enzyme
LERKIRPPYLRQEVLLEHLRRTLAFLIEKRNIPLSDLARARYILEKQLRDKIKSYYDDAIAKGYQTKLFGANAAVETNYEDGFAYPTDPFQYPAHWYCKGRYVWNKHYYPLIGELESEGEEFECAQAIDRNMSVRCWVRNISKLENSFRLPTSTDYFYPDFVALLNDGRTLVIRPLAKVINMP